MPIHTLIMVCNYTKLALLILCLLAANSAFANVDDEYIVKSGDTLSQISEKLYGKFVYGSRGSMKVLLSTNPHLSDPNRLVPGTKLKLFKSESLLKREVASLKLESQNGLADNLNVQEGPLHNECVVESALFKRHSEYSASIGGGYTKITGADNGSKYSLFSNFNLSADLSWAQYWSDRVSTWISGGFERVEYMDSSTYTVQQNKYYSQLNVGLKYGKNIIFEMGAGIRQEPFVKIESAVKARVDKINISNQKIGAKVPILKMEPFNLGIDLQGQVLNATSNGDYVVNTGYRGNAAIYIEESSKLGAAINYSSSAQNGNQFTKSYTEIGLKLFYQFK